MVCGIRSNEASFFQRILCLDVNCLNFCMVFKVVKCTYLVLPDTWVFCGVFMLRVRLACEAFMHSPSIQLCGYMPWYAPVKKIQGIKGSNFDRRWLLSSLQKMLRTTWGYNRLCPKKQIRRIAPVMQAWMNCMTLGQGWKYGMVACAFMFGIGMLHLYSCGVFFFWNSWRIFCSPRQKAWGSTSWLHQTSNLGSEMFDREELGDVSLIQLHLWLMPSRFLMLAKNEDNYISLELLLVSQFHHNIKI